MITLILVGFAVLAAYCFHLKRHPIGPCGKCSGSGKNKGSNRKRWGACKRCSGTGQRKRPGATAVHRFWWSLAGETLHRRRKERVKARREKAGYPE